ncbi:lipopolysaccharide biosynthesis protein [Knoellia sp. LjRoot47]|uniref:lipopolysaccharide biosynthesis protein n=1 Tax=Knoellia sp. LjRoot47 TaxID=3342330 RepID=UPI003ED12491
MPTDTASSPRRVSARSSAALSAVGAGTLLANVVAYALFLVLNRELGADDLGAVASLLNLVIIAGVAALSTQLVSAWRVALHRPDAHASALRTGVVVGLVVTGAVLVLTPIIVRVLHLSGPAPVLLVAAAMTPTCVTAGVQGSLQGGERFVALGSLYAVVSLLRTAGGAGAAVLGWGVTGVMALTTAAAWLVAAGAVLLVRGHLRRSLDADVPTQVRRVLVGMAGTSALLVASTVDTPVARHVLPGDSSGAYAVLSLFAKAAFWGPAFLVTVLYPGMSRARGARPLLLALGGTAAIVAVGVALSAALSSPLIRVVGGPAYEHLADLVPVFTALGGAWALSQVLVFWGAARGWHVVGYLVWTAVAVATLVTTVWRHDTLREVATTFLVAALVVAALGTLVSLPRPARRPLD